MTFAFIILLLSSSFSFPALGQQKLEDFDTFRSRFFSDSTFQIERIRFPLQVVVNNTLEDKSDTSYVSKELWKFSNLHYVEEVELLVKGGEPGHLAERVVHIHGTESGVNVQLFFKRVGRKWYLFHVLDEST